MQKLLGMVKNFFKGWTEKKITLTLIMAGTSIVIAGYSNVFMGLLIALLDYFNGEDVKVQEYISVDYAWAAICTVVGGILIISGLVFYKSTKIPVGKESLIRIAHSSIGSTEYSKVDTDLSDFNVEDFILNQTEELNLINEQNLYHALREQEKVKNKILERLNGQNDIELSYWGLAHVPLVFLMGYQIANKSNCTFYEWNQNDLLWERISNEKKDFPILKLTRNNPSLPASDVDEVVIKIGITYPISNNDIDGLDLERLNSYYLFLEKPQRNTIVSVEQLNQYQKKFRELLDEINNSFPTVKKIHIFYSGQTSLAYRLGSAISSRMDKEIWIYNYLVSGNPKYNWAINLTDGSYKEIKIIEGASVSEGYKQKV